MIQPKLIIMGYIKDLFISIDQLGNALAGGNPDNTISARVGYFANHNEKTKNAWHWKAFQWTINFAFWPVDGEGHCHQAYHNDAGEKFQTGYKFLYYLAAVIIITSCIPISILTYLSYLFGMRPNEYNRLENICKQTEAIDRELEGISHLLEEVNSTNATTVNCLEKNVAKAQEVLQIAKNKTP